ncbi:MAG: hypothetical protein JJ992_20040, partial [Planctomycetes bacterium]|nr:hypothetical protein [Planctomycetota bacterium]
RNGATEIELSLTRQGFDAASPLTLDARARRLTLDRRFVEVLPKPQQGLWRKYFPMGVIDADVHLEFDGRQWHPDVQIECNDVSFVYHAFPYRLERVRGSISLKQDQLAIRLQAAAGSQTVNITGAIRQPGEAGAGWVEIACERPIPLDEKLLDAVIDPKAKDVIRSLNPGGTLAMVGRFERRQPGGEIHKFVRIDLHNCTMRYERFPYPLGMIRGTIVWDDEGWTFQNLSGRNDSGYIECEGNWAPNRDGDSVLTLKFVGTDVPLADELREALNPSANRAWADLHPRGWIDRLDVTLGYNASRKDLSLEVRGQKWKKRPNDEGRSITVMPKWLPYRLDDVTGVFVYHNGDVLLQGMSARHDETVLSLDGHCRFEPHGPWAAEINNLVVDRIRFDADMLDALPAELGHAIGKLSPRGNLSMHGSLAFRGFADGTQPTGSGWDLTIDVEGGSLGCGLQLEHIHGDVRLMGSRLGQDFFSRGELNVDSLVYQDLQLTQIRGPLLIQRDRIALGAEAERDRTDAPPRSLVAQVVGGTLSSDIVVYPEGDVPFRLSASLERGDLQQFAREMSPNNQQIRGKANALVNLSGTAQGRHTWRGDGFVRLYEADIYEIPVMLALLKVLSIRRPDRTAFTSSDIDFEIQGEHLY